jgi:hypothetical protein
VPFPDLPAMTTPFAGEPFQVRQESFPDPGATPTPFASGLFPGGQVQFPTARTPQPHPAPAFVGQASSQFEAPATERWQPLRPGLAGLSRPTPGSLHRMRLQTGDNNASRQPQLVGAGSGGGLLSRYREMHTQSGLGVE